MVEARRRGAACPRGREARHSLPHVFRPGHQRGCSRSAWTTGTSSTTSSGGPTDVASWRWPGMGSDNECGESPIRTGHAEPVPDDSSDYADASLSRDAQKLLALQSSERSDVLVSAWTEVGPFKRVAGGTDVRHKCSGWTVDGQVVYSANDSGSYDLYVVDPDGSNRKQLTFDRAANETEPAASPDGRYIVFVSDRSGERGLYRIDTDGTGLMKLTTPDPSHGHRSPQFTPDSRWVVYQRWDNGRRRLEGLHRWRRAGPHKGGPHWWHEGHRGVRFRPRGLAGRPVGGVLLLHEGPRHGGVLGNGYRHLLARGPDRQAFPVSREQGRS